jgi:LysR family transcriptional regulator of gallate degradation
MSNIGVRQARMFLAVARNLSISQGAKSINRSPTSVTKTLRELERSLGVRLFDRSSRGVLLTTFGAALFSRSEEAARTFERAGEVLRSMSATTSSGVARFIQMDVSDRWLDAFLATANHQNTAAAAAQLGISSAGVSSSLRKLETSLCLSLFDRQPATIVPTNTGKALVGFVKLARRQLRHALDDIANLQGIEHGRVVIGTLPFARTMIVPQAINSLLRDCPNIEIATSEGAYDDLVADLRCGDIDFMIGALRGTGDATDLLEEILLEDSLSVIARADHPLAEKSLLDNDDLANCEWILPRHGTPTRALFEQVVTAHGISIPQHVTETSSLVVLRGLLLGSDRITLLSRHQIHYEEECGMLVALPYLLTDVSRPIGITQRAGSSLSPAAGKIIDTIRQLVEDNFSNPLSI